jgi:antitoxin component of MazEF toxin-antitoxin module
MSDKKYGQTNIRKLIKVGPKKGSLSLTLPVSLVGELGWKEKQKVVVKRKGSKLIVSDWKARKK